MTSVPVAYIIFNRPDLTQATFSALIKQQPTELFIIADGPRPGHPTDAVRCRETRASVEHIDWPCHVHRNYSDSNLGCRKRVLSGLDWVFSEVDRAIILEDDCLPHPDFYTFCQTMLDRYENDERIWVASGSNFQNGKRRGDASYYFSRFNHCWGWATWRRAWQQNEPQMSFWPQWKQSQEWKAMWPHRRMRSYWEEIFDRMYREEIDSWAYSWKASAWYHGGLTATPNVNLVSNIGFGPEATHTQVESPVSRLQVASLGPIVHPERVEVHKKADNFTYWFAFKGRRQGFKKQVIRSVTKLKRALTRMKHRIVGLSEAPFVNHSAST